MRVAAGGLSAGGRNGAISAADLIDSSTGEAARFAPPVRTRRSTAVPIRELPQRQPHVCIDTHLCIVAQTHVHSLQRCDRSKRVCTAQGRFREGEALRAVAVPAEEERFVDASAATIFGDVIAAASTGKRSALPGVEAELATLKPSVDALQWWRSEGGPWDLSDAAAYCALPPPEQHEAPERWSALLASMVPISAAEGGITRAGEPYELAVVDIGRCIGVSPFRSTGPMAGDARLAADTCVGPIESAPPFISKVEIAVLDPDRDSTAAFVPQSQFKEGQTVYAQPTYFGGVPGRHIFRWMAISAKGIRVDVVLPTICEQPRSPPGSYEGDPRVLFLSKELAGCKLKVKIVAFRSDGADGNDMSSKPSRAVEWVSTPPPTPPPSPPPSPSLCSTPSPTLGGVGHDGSAAVLESPDAAAAATAERQPMSRARSLRLLKRMGSKAGSAIKGGVSKTGKVGSELWQRIAQTPRDSAAAAAASTTATPRRRSVMSKKASLLWSKAKAHVKGGGAPRAAAAAEEELLPPPPELPPPRRLALPPPAFDSQPEGGGASGGGASGGTSGVASSGASGAVSGGVSGRSASSRTRSVRIVRTVEL